LCWKHSNWKGKLSKIVINDRKLRYLKGNYKILKKIVEFCRKCKILTKIVKIGPKFFKIEIKVVKIKKSLSKFQKKLS
jgi:hypothetical protein